MIYLTEIYYDHEGDFYLKELCLFRLTFINDVFWNKQKKLPCQRLFPVSYKTEVATKDNILKQAEERNYDFGRSV